MSPPVPSGILPSARHRSAAGNTVVAAEQLVAAVARQRDRDVLARQLRDEKGRDLRGVGERLVIHLGQARDHVERMLGRDVKLGVVGAEMRARRPWRAAPRCSRCSWKPIEKVRTGRVLCACISATTVDESMPPDRNAPSGTSAIMRRLTASRSSASSARRPPPRCRRTARLWPSRAISLERPDTARSPARRRRARRGSCRAAAC